MLARVIKSSTRHARAKSWYDSRFAPHHGVGESHMSRTIRFSGWTLAVVLSLGASLSGCALHREAPGVPIDQRARPPQPSAQPAAPPATTDTIPVPPPRPMTPSGEENVRALAVRDTLVVS